MAKKKSEIINTAVEAVKSELHSKLCARWQLGKCLNDLWSLRPQYRPDNNAPIYDTAIATLNKQLQAATGQEFSTSSWLHWRMLGERINDHGINALAAECVTEHEAVLAVYQIGPDSKRISDWIMAVMEGKKGRSHYTQQATRDRKTRKRTSNSSAGDNADRDRCIMVSPPLDKDKILNLFRSTLRFAVIGGLCVDDVDKCYSDAKMMM